MPSSVIRWMQYDPWRRTLLIAFRGNRGAYRYFDVPLREWKAFRSAPSKGTYLNSEFKEAGHGYEAVDGNEAAFRGLLDPEYRWGRPPEGPAGQPNGGS